MTTKLLIGMTGICFAILLLAYGCQTDRTYRDEYIDLLEQRINTLSDVQEPSNLVELSEQEVRLQLEELVSFACGSIQNVNDMRVRRKAVNMWSAILEVETDSIDGYGFIVTKRVLLEGEVRQGVLNVDNIDKLISACE